MKMEKKKEEEEEKKEMMKEREKQGRIHGNPVADGWAGAVTQKPLGIRKCDGQGVTKCPSTRAALVGS